MKSEETTAQYEVRSNEESFGGDQWRVWADSCISPYATFRHQRIADGLRAETQTSPNMSLRNLPQQEWRKSVFRSFFFLLLFLLFLFVPFSMAKADSPFPHHPENVWVGDTIAPTLPDTLIAEEPTTLVDTISFSTSETDSNAKKKRDWNTWRPNPKRAMWLAIIIPGAGQIYNRKYWKLPIVYGGFVGCAYAMRWNNMMYHDYAQAYLDIMDNDPNTHSYDQFLHLGNQINDNNRRRYQDLFKSRKDRYRRWRDLSFFVMCGVYAVSIIDAYVDASLSEFDISDDLSMRVTPTIINDQSNRNPWKSSAIGLQCSLNF